MFNIVGIMEIIIEILKILRYQNIKICIAKQAKQIFQYKKIKIKLYKNDAAIWYNKTCRIKQLTPNYINIRVNGNNTRFQKTKNTAIRYRINQELKFLYIKKQQLNKQLYKIHLKCAAHWPTTWNLIQATMDKNIHQEYTMMHGQTNIKIRSLCLAGGLVMDMV